MNVYFFNTAKRSNSTLIPSNGILFANISIIDVCSVLAPTLRINADTFEYNYCYIPDEPFARYYFINEITWHNGIWEASCAVDVLASHRTAILSTETYVVRSASDYDEYIADGTVLAKSHKTFRSIGERELTHLNYENVINLFHDTNPYGIWSGGFVVAISGTPQLPIGTVAFGMPLTSGVTYYFMDYRAVSGLINSLYSNVSIYNISITEISEALQKQLINPAQYIAGIYYIPWKPTLVQEVISSDPLITRPVEYTSINVGFNSLSLGMNQGNNITCNTIVSPTYDESMWDTSDTTGYISTHQFDIKIPCHPETANHRRWANLAPWSTFSLDVEPFGKVVLDNSLIAHAFIYFNGVNPFFDIRCNTLMDAVNRSVQLRISVRTGNNTWSNDLMILNSDIGINIPIASTSQNFLGAARGALTMSDSAIGIATGSGAMASNAIGNFYGAAIDVAASIFPKLQTYGSMGGNFLAIMTNYGNVLIDCEYTELTPTNIDDDGLPLHQVKLLSTLSGFCMCRDAEIGISRATSQELSQIITLMKGGFFIE